MKAITFVTLKAIVVLLFSVTVAQNETDSPVVKYALREENDRLFSATDHAEENLSEQTDNRQLAGTRPPIVSVILGSLTVLTASLTLYRFIESRGAKERQAHYYSLVDELTSMLDELSSKAREQEKNLKAFECRYEIERGIVPPGCKEYPTPSNLKTAQQVQLTEFAAVKSSPEAETWFKGLRNVNRNGRRLSETIKIGYLGF